MTPKIGNQHYLLHYYYPNDCCLCKSETLLRETQAQLKQVEAQLLLVRKESAELKRGEATNLGDTR